MPTSSDLPDTPDTAARVQHLEREVAYLRRALESAPSDAALLSRLLDRVVRTDAGLPGLGGWALSAATLLALVDEIDRRAGPVTVLECGCGASTLYLALVLAHRGRGGHVWALENNPEFAEETRQRLRDHGVSELATVVDAPLVDLWFDLAGLPDEVAGVDILFVDGPFGQLAPEVRHPAYPRLHDRLAPGALVVLDDTDRPDEQSIVSRWLAADLRLGFHRDNARTTFLRFAGQA